MPSRNLQQRGFSLVEIMVALVITLIATIVMFQVFALSERQKRTATGASDAQTNGALSLYVLEREIRMAGSGFLASTLMNDCNPATTYTYSKATETNPYQNDALGLNAPPVLITDGVGGAPDRISINRMSSSNDPSVDDPNLFGRVLLEPGKSPHWGMPDSSSELKVTSTYGCKDGGLLLMVQPTACHGTTAGSCTLMELTNVQDSSLMLQHNPGGTQNYNPPKSGAYKDWPGYKADDTDENCQAYGICIPKPDPSMNQTFSIDANYNLSLELGGSQPLIVAPGVIDMQAEYGINTAAAGHTGKITWQAPTGAWAGPSLTQTQMKQIRAVRFAMIARSGEYEKPTNAAGTCDATTTAPSYSWGTFDTTKWPADWKCYRYKVFETQVPLINVIWMNVSPTP